MMSCYLCNTSKPQKGGSLASDNVVNIVDAGTFEVLNKNFTNQLGGGDDVKIYNSMEGGKNVRTRRTRRSIGMRRPMRGGNGCGEQIINDVPSNYTVNNGNIPLALPAQSLTSTANIVAESLAAQSTTNTNVFNRVFYPDYIGSHVQGMQQVAMSGGSGCSFCLP